jgi:ATP-binding cassette subfamily C (CFTR/MRP) protein 1
MIYFRLTLCIANVPTDLAPFATFSIYAVICAIRKDESSLSTQAFTSLALISLMTAPLLTFVQTMPKVWQVIACFKRIEAYQKLRSESTSTGVHHFGGRPDEKKDTAGSPAKQLEDILFSLKNVNILRGSQGNLVLQDVSLDLRQGITMIIGPVGSGKTTLIETMLGEHRLHNGWTSDPLSQVAYCSQTPWIQNKTIRDIIIGASIFSQCQYEHALSVSGLRDSLVSLPQGDLTTAGSGGNNLSGGQKQRIVSFLIIDRLSELCS